MLQELLDNLLLQNTNVIKLGLDNIASAARILHLTKPAPYVITIAGTNGKGSVITLLEAFLVKLGFNTGCYTSPHLVTFNERIRINQQHFTDDELVTAFNYISKILDQHKIKLTFFEFITLGAWYIFSSKQLDIVLLEIGLGGRLDAVNAIPKDLAVITSIDFDHQEYLGNTLEEIGFEKAGIISPMLPVIFGDVRMPEVIAEQAAIKQSELQQYSIDYNVSEQDAHLVYTSSQVQALTLDKNSHTNLRANNIATSLQALDSYLRSKNSNLQQVWAEINNTFKNFQFPGRGSWLDDSETVLLDVAHNPQSVANLKTYLSYLVGLNNKKIIAVFGMLKDKDIAQCITLINPIIDHWYLTGTDKERNGTVNKRGTSAEELADILIAVDSDSKHSCFDNILASFQAAYNFIKQNANNDSILVVFGSFHIVGPVYDHYRTIT